MFNADDRDNSRVFRQKSMKMFHATLFSFLLLTISLAGCLESSEDQGIPSSEYEDNIASLEEEIELLNNEIENKNSEIASHLNQIESLNSEISSLKANIASLNLEIASLHANNDSAVDDSKISELENLNRDLNLTIVSLNAQILEYQQALSDRDQSISDYIELLGGLQSENTNLTNEILELNSLIQNMQSTIDELQSALYPYSCPLGSVLSKVSIPSIYANPGVVFSNVSNYEDHNPQSIQYQVTLNGTPLEGCEVRFEIEEDHGWFFPANRQTNSEGMIYGYWTAGRIIGEQNMSAYITWPTGEKMYQNISGEVTDVRLIAASIWSRYQFSGEFDEFSIRATPGTGPRGTYYSTINWKGSYGGIQFNNADTTTVIFSTWDTNGRDAEITDNGSCNEIVGFSGEGTGVSCRLKFPPSQYGAITGLPDDYMLVTGHTYQTSIQIQDCGTNCQSYTFMFEDITRGFGPISLGTQEYKSDSVNDRASSFVEDFYRQGNCVTGYQGESAERSVLYHDIRARVDGVNESSTQDTFNAIYDGWDEEICSNYYSERTESGIFLSSGGDRFVGPPIIAGDSNFPGYRPIVQGYASPDVA